MVHPVFIHHTQHDDPLQLPHDGRCDLGLLGLVSGLGGLDKGVGEVLLGLGGNVGLGDLHGAGQEVGALQAPQHLPVTGGVQGSLLAEGQGHVVGDGGAHHVQHGLLQVFAVQHLTALGIDDFPLLVHDIVVFQHGFPGLEVPGLHGGLGVFNGLGEHLIFDGGVLVQVELLHHVGDALTAEQAHEVIFQRDVEPGLAGVALAAGTAAELVVDAAGLVALGADDEQSAGGADLFGLAGDLRLVLGQLLGKQGPGGQNVGVVGIGVAGGVHDDLFGITGLHQVGPGQVLGVAAQHDVSAAAGHVGGHGDGAQLAGLGHDLGFLLMVLGVEEVVGDALPGQQMAQKLVFLNGHSAHQYRLALGVALLDLGDDGPELACLGFVHHIVVIHALVGAVGGDLHDVQVVDGAELLLLRHGGTGHAGQLVVQAEIILEGNGGQGLVLAVDVDMLLGLDGLVQAIGVAAAEHEAARELVHDDDLAVLHHVVHVPLHGAMGLQGLVDVVAEGGVGGVGQVFHVEEFLRLGDAPGGEGGGLGLFVHHIVGVDIDVFFLLVVHLDHHLLFQAGDEHLRHVVQLGGLVALAGDDEGGAGLVDEDRVHLVHDGKGMTPLHQLAGVDAHVVPQVIEAHLVVGAIGDIGGIGLLALLVGKAVDDEAHLQPQEAVDLAHPLAVALGQIVVDGDDVDAPARQGVEVGGEGGHQGLAFTGLHLGDAALVQHDAAHQLHPVGAHSQHAVGGLPHGGKGLRQNIVQRFAVLEARLELGGFCLQLGVGHGLVLIGHGLDLIHDGIDGFQLPGTVIAKQFFHQTHNV